MAAWSDSRVYAADALQMASFGVQCLACAYACVISAVSKWATRLSCPPLPHPTRPPIPFAALFPQGPRAFYALRHHLPYVDTALVVAFYAGNIVYCAIDSRVAAEPTTARSWSVLVRGAGQMLMDSIAYLGPHNPSLLCHPSPRPHHPQSARVFTYMAVWSFCFAAVPGKPARILGAALLFGGAIVICG